MTALTLTRRNSGFANIPSGYLIGERCGDPYKGDDVADYDLPEGYEIARSATGEELIYNAAGEYCAIIAHNSAHQPPMICDGERLIVLSNPRNRRNVASF